MEERRRHTTVRQLEVMLEFLEVHRDLALGRVRSKEARALAQRLWQECSELLNPLGPARTAKEWSKVWNDQKTKVRAKLVSINSSQRATGGGPSTAPILSCLEERIANIIGRDVGPLPLVAQDQFAVSEDAASLNVLPAEEMIVETGNNSPPPLLNIQGLDFVEPEVVLPDPVAPVQPPLESVETPAAERTRRERRRARILDPIHTTAHSSTSRQTPQIQSAGTALEKSQAIMLRIEELRAEAALVNAHGFNTIADSIKSMTDIISMCFRPPTDA